MKKNFQTVGGIPSSALRGNRSETTPWGELAVWVEEQGGWPTYCQGPGCYFSVLGDGRIVCNCQGTWAALPEPFHSFLRHKLNAISSKYRVHTNNIFKHFNALRQRSTTSAWGGLEDIQLPQICGTKVCPPGWVCQVGQDGSNSCIWTPPNAPKTPGFTSRQSNPSFMQKVTGLVGWSGTASDVTRIKPRKRRPYFTPVLTTPLGNRSLV